MPSLRLLLLSMVVDAGGGTGWTLFSGEAPLNTIRCGEPLFYSFIYSAEVTTSLNYSENVKMSFIRGQSAWVNLFSPSETKHSAFFSMFAKYKDPIASEEVFHKWLVGVVDGDGTFHFSKSKKGY